MSIRALKRFVTSRLYGPETGDYRTYCDACNRDMLPPNCGDYQRVAVVGVAGMTVAHDLALLGYKVTVFEAWSRPGGITHGLFLQRGLGSARPDASLLRHRRHRHARAGGKTR